MMNFLEKTHNYNILELFRITVTFYSYMFLPCLYECRQAKVSGVRHGM